MKFTDKDKEYILKCYSGETAQMEQDLPQIERAADASATEYELLNSDGRGTADNPPPFFLSSIYLAIIHKNPPWLSLPVHLKQKK